MSVEALDTNPTWNQFNDDANKIAQVQIQPNIPAVVVLPNNGHAANEVDYDATNTVEESEVNRVIEVAPNEAQPLLMQIDNAEFLSQQPSPPMGSIGDIVSGLDNIKNSLAANEPEHNPELHPVHQFVPEQTLEVNNPALSPSTGP